MGGTSGEARRRETLTTSGGRPGEGRSGELEERTWEKWAGAEERGSWGADSDHRLYIKNKNESKISRIEALPSSSSFGAWAAVSRSCWYSTLEGQSWHFTCFYSIKLIFTTKLIISLVHVPCANMEEAGFMTSILQPATRGDQDVLALPMRSCRVIHHYIQPMIHL